MAIAISVSVRLVVVGIGIGNANYRRPGTLAIWPYPAPWLLCWRWAARKNQVFPSLVQAA